MKSGHNIRSQQQQQQQQQQRKQREYHHSVRVPTKFIGMADRFMGLSSRRTYPAL